MNSVCNLPLDKFFWPTQERKTIGEIREQRSKGEMIFRWHLCTHMNVLFNGHKWECSFKLPQKMVPVHPRSYSATRIHDRCTRPYLSFRTCVQSKPCYWQGQQQLASRLSTFSPSMCGRKETCQKCSVKEVGDHL
jgi:hypothetical protein